MLASIVLMTVDHRQHHLQDIREGLSVLLSPLQYAVSLPARLGEWAAESLAFRSSLLEENRQLREEHLLLRGRQQRFEALEAENRRLRALLQSSQRVADRMLVGELLAVDVDPFKRQAILNKGRADGVFDGHPLLDANGVVGQIIHITPHTSTAMLLTDPGSAIPVQINRTGMRAIAVGSGAPDTLDIPFIPNNDDVQEGDLLVTSGLGGRFPAGYPVARITTFELDPTRPYARVSATPAADLENIREVLLVWPNGVAGP